MRKMIITMKMKTALFAIIFYKRLPYIGSAENEIFVLAAYVTLISDVCDVMLA